MPVHAVQSASQAAQVALLVALQAAVWYWPAPQVEQALHTVSCVGVQALAWNSLREQTLQATHAPPTRWNPCAQAVQVVAPVQAAHPAGQDAQVVFAAVVQAAVWYCPAAHTVHALQTTPVPVNPGLHVQLKAPGVFAQFASVAQLEVPAVHSSMSVQPPAPPPV